MISAVLLRLREEQQMHLAGGLYHKTQIAFAFHTGNIEGSKLTEDQTRSIFETKTLGIEGSVRLDDAVEADNHFRCFDFVLDNIESELNIPFIKELHKILKSGTSDSRKEWFAVGEWKKRPNEVGGNHTTEPAKADAAVKKLLAEYNAKKTKTFEDIIGFHHDFEAIHPFQDGNGRVGRLIMFRECLANNIIPFIIEGDKKDFYYRGLREWRNERGFLIDTLKAAQDTYKNWLEYFEIKI